MKHVKKLLLTLLLSHFFGPLVIQAQNLVQNGSFENDLANWWTNSENGAEAVFSIITDDVQEGGKALKVEVIASGPNPWNVQAVSDPWASKVGTEYTLRFRARAASSGSSFKAIMQLDPAYAERVFTLTESWEEYEWTFTAQANGLQLKFHFPSEGTFFFDAISIPDEEDEVETEELIANGNFESGAGNSFTNWWFGEGSGSAMFSAEMDDAYEGSRSLKVEVFSLGANPWDIQGINDAWPSKTGEAYVLSFWAKADAEGRTLKAVMQIGSSYAEQVFTLTEDWKQYQWPFTAGANNLELKFQFTSVGTFYIDQVSVPSEVGPDQPGEGEVVLVEAESGSPVAPSDPAVFLFLEEGDVEFVRVQEDFAATAYPGTESRLMTYTITFPEPGTYDLYARMRVGAGGFNDDSFYYGNGFGLKSASDSDDWIMVNGLSPVGFDEPDQIVSEGGMAGNEVWKWLKLSSFSGQGDTGVQFEVPEGNLTQTFQIGSRENGFDLDKFAFGTAGVFFTVDNLDKGEAGTTVPPPPPFTPTGEPIAKGHPKFLGNIFSPSQVDFFTNYWNQVTPENAGKWGSVEGTRDVMNWTQLDEAYALAKDNGFPFRFHVLIWGNQQPVWIEDLSPEEQLEEIEEWFSEVAQRYPDIDFIEVVNEPINDPPRRRNEGDTGSGNYFEALGGEGETGWDWILTSFRLAKKHFPNTKLMINEYSVTNNATTAQRYLEIIQLLQAENLIDLIGVQGHAFSTRVPAEITQQNLDLLASSGLPIQVTEMDVDGTDDQFHLQEYQRIFPVFWEHPAVAGITLWGWKPGMWRTSQGAYLALENGAERPALVWLREYVESTKPDQSNEGVVKFVLINAETDQELYELEDGATIDLQEIGTKAINIRAFTNPNITGSVRFSLTGEQVYTHIENVEPYALFLNDGDDYRSWFPSPGSYQLTATSFSEARGNGDAGTSLTVSFTIVDDTELPVVEKLTLYNASTDEELFEIVDGSIINLTDLGTDEINIRAYTDPEVTGSVRFVLSGAANHIQVENNEPYALFQNDGDDFFPWTPVLGDYDLTVTPYTESRTRGEAGTPMAVSFTIAKVGGENQRISSPYPNPGSSYLNIPTGGAGGSITVMISDLAGRAVLTRSNFTIVDNQIQLDISGLENRTYIIKVISGDKVNNFRWAKN